MSLRTTTESPRVVGVVEVVQPDGCMMVRVDEGQTKRNPECLVEWLTPHLTLSHLQVGDRVTLVYGMFGGGYRWFVDSLNTPPRI